MDEEDGVKRNVVAAVVGKTMNFLLVFAIALQLKNEYCIAAKTS